MYWCVLVCAGAPAVVLIEDPFDQDDWEGLGATGVELGWNWAGTRGNWFRTGLYWCVLVCAGLYWCVLVCTGVYWCAPAVVSIEDPFDQDDWEGWRRFVAQVPIQVVGDDLTVTNPRRIQRAAELGACNCLLLKVNQIGSVAEAVRA